MSKDLNNDWVLITASADKFDLELKKKRLEEAGILSVLFNHQDSMIPSLNETDYEVGLYVHRSQAEKAKAIIE